MALPATFIQLHYHNRPGGVSTVMNHYANAFVRNSNQKFARSILLCNGKNDGVYFENTLVRSIRGFGYRKFFKKQSFIAHRQKLLNQLERLFYSNQLSRPICVVGHNLCLGKNIALSAAFACAARKFNKYPQDIRFYSVVHDFAREGRVDLLSDIRRVASWNFPVWQYLYPSRYGVRFVAVSSRTRDILNAGGIEAFLLPNRVSGPQNISHLKKHEKYEISRALKKLSELDGTGFDLKKKNVFYPVRIMPRKNIVEAIILACIVHHANLLLGAPGNSHHERILYSNLKSLCRKKNFSVVFDIYRARDMLKSSLLRKINMSEIFYQYCDCAISTSIAEGFGYALYEPWLYKRSLLGRRPSGAVEEYGMSLKHLYTSFNIPAQWVSLKKLAKAYGNGLESCFAPREAMRKKKCLLEKISMDVREKGSVDSGFLDVKMQMDIAGRIANRSDLIRSLIDKNRATIQSQKLFFLRRKSLDIRELIENNRKAILGSLNKKNFDCGFVHCFSRSLCVKSLKKFNHKKIAAFFPFEDALRPLMRSNTVIREKK